MENSFQTKNIKLDELILWDENARFPDNYAESTEKDLIEYFISKKNFKIETLIEEIVKDIDLPQLEKLVVFKDEENNIVLEGNRRLTSYKILANPELINDKHSKLKQKVLALNKESHITNDFKLECLVSSEKSDCFRYIDRKHDNGNNEVNWQQPERENYSYRRGNANYTTKLRLALTNYLRELDLPEEIKNTVIGKGYITNLYRLTTTGPAREKFKISLNEDGSLAFDTGSEFKLKLKFIVLELFENKEVNGQSISRAYNKTPQIKNYLDTIPADSKVIQEKVKDLKKKDLFGKESITKPEKSKSKNTSIPPKKILPKSTDRTYLIPKNCRITISQNKINDIYRELRDNLILNDSTGSVPNAVGVLFRVFLEISLDEYAEKNMKMFKREDTIKQKIPWVINSLKDKGYDAKTFKEINKVGSAKNEKSFLSIERFHEYVHSKTVQPSPKELKTKWDLLQPFFELLWDDLNKRKK